VRLTEECRPNEVYFSCGNACEITCANVTESDQYPLADVQIERACKYNCVSGCFCRPPLLRNRFAQCVKEVNCHPQHSRDSLVQELNQVFAGQRRRIATQDQMSSSLDSFFDDFSIDAEVDRQLDSLFGAKQSDSGGKISTKADHSSSNGSSKPSSVHFDSTDELEAYVESETDKIINQVHRGLK
jgi:hypothetical protein